MPFEDIELNGLAEHSSSSSSGSDNSKNSVDEKSSSSGSSSSSASSTSSKNADTVKKSEIRTSEVKKTSGKKKMSKKTRLGLAIGIPVAVVVILIIVLCACLCGEKIAKCSIDEDGSTVSCGKGKVNGDSLEGAKNATTLNFGDFNGKFSEDAFDGLDKLTEIKVSDTNEKYSSMSGVLYDKEAKELVRIPEGRSEAIVLEDSVKILRSHSVKGFKKDITVPKELESIEKGAFGKNENSTLIVKDAAQPTVSGIQGTNFFPSFFSGKGTVDNAEDYPKAIVDSLSWGFDLKQNALVSKSVTVQLFFHTEEDDIKFMGSVSSEAYMYPIVEKTIGKGEFPVYAADASKITFVEPENATLDSLKNEISHDTYESVTMLSFTTGGKKYRFDVEAGDNSVEYIVTVNEEAGSVQDYALPEKTKFVVGDTFAFAYANNSLPMTITYNDNILEFTDNKYIGSEAEITCLPSAGTTKFEVCTVKAKEAGKFSSRNTPGGRVDVKVGDRLAINAENGDITNDKGYTFTVTNLREETLNISITKQGGSAETASYKGTTLTGADALTTYNLSCKNAESGVNTTTTCTITLKAAGTGGEKHALSLTTDTITEAKTATLTVPQASA